PVGRALAFEMFRFALQFLVKNFFHFRADGLHLRRAEAGTDDEKFSERAEARKIQNGNGGGFLVLRRLNCEAHGFGKGVDFHLDSFTSRTLPVEALLKNVFLDARGYKPMNGLAAVGAFARFRGGDVTRNGFEKMDGSLAQVSDELRRRHGFAFALGVGAGHEVGRDYKLERFRANSRAIGDDEIAKTEQGLVFLPHGNVEKGVGADHEKDAVAVTGVSKIPNRVHRIMKLRAGEIFAGFGERGNKVRMFRAGERYHGKAMRKRRKVLLQFVRRAARGDEMNFVEVETAVGGGGGGGVGLLDLGGGNRQKSGEGGGGALLW